MAVSGEEVSGRTGDTADTDHLHEEAIRSARENGFVQNEALAYEVAARYHRTRGRDRIADLYPGAWWMAPPARARCR